MGVPVVHACSVLAAPPEPGSCPEGGYVRRVTELDYDVVWVELLDCDGVAPYGYSEDEIAPSLPELTRD